ncbi:lanthionine synthetase LanC family protein [Rhizobium paknamense]|uniref:Lantibiotic modifying enzyme n=1 Tax=Rhizobium paknamense TaxID=1206817 RepID=A0ABU0I941_9HYPH|nr:lanthionine synthetase LanC family protein [Rhizobium paknamense]MDQ0454754.1 lantibiotic modifying enzyme [Rhizobium paknamense]
MNTMLFSTAAVGDRAFLDAANRIGRQLCRDAIWHEDRCTWMGWAMAANGTGFGPAYKTVSANIYDGVAGIALFLSALHAQSPSPPVLATIEGAVRQMRARLSDFDTPAARGYYTGTLGIASAWIGIGESLQRKELIEEGLLLAERHAEEVFGEEMIDMIGGAASAIPVLIGLGSRYQRPSLTQAALAHAERLLAKAVLDERGLSWPCQMPRHHNLLGYAHGVAGMALALLEAHAAGGAETLLQGALQGLRYERSWFDPQRQAWPDFRIDYITPGAATAPPNCNCAWCSGSTGIGLSRLRMLELLPQEPGMAVELNAAVQDASRLLTMPTTPAQQTDLCLCHGLTGIADFLLSVGTQLKRDDISLLAEQVGQYVIAHFISQDLPLPCGVQGRGEAPGLLLGLAGIGYFFLRLYEKGALPSVLLLKP